MINECISFLRRNECIRRISIITNNPSQEYSFAKTLDRGMEILDGYMDEMDASGSTVLDGELAFKLYDTYGFPLEVTQEILEEKGKTVDVDGFTEKMNAQKELARANQRDTEGDAWRDASEYSHFDLHPIDSSHLKSIESFYHLIKTACILY